jgi:two-component system NtrC family sensor kinase
MNIIDKLQNRMIRMGFKGRLIAGFIIATCFSGFVAISFGIWTIDKITLAEVQSRVRQGISTAKLIYNYSLESLASRIQYAVESHVLHESIVKSDQQSMNSLQRLLRSQEVSLSSPLPSTDHSGFDMLTLVDNHGTVLYRAGNPEKKGDNVLWDPVIRKCIENLIPIASTELIPIEKIILDNPDLAKRVGIEIIEDPLSAKLNMKRLSEGMVMRAAHPILDQRKKLVGVLVGGILLNGDSVIVDKIQQTVYQGEKYNGREMGVATIFQYGVRVATNVLTNKGERAIGTVLSKPVYDVVIKEGKDWNGRAMVVNDWYITTYTPIYNMDRKLIGILYTGLLEARYKDIRWKTIITIMSILTLGMILAFLISLRTVNTLIPRIRLLKEASEAIASGNLDYHFTPSKSTGFAVLDKAFNNMAKSLKDRDDFLRKRQEQLMRSEKLTALGMMAAGVAHEINNPLGGILLYSNLVLEDIPEDSPARENMEKIIHQTVRCKNLVQNLLFARMPAGEMLPLQIKDVINDAIALLKDQLKFQDIDIEKDFHSNLPEVNGDKARLEELFLNLLGNAADAMDGKGKLTIATRLKDDGNVEITITDTGSGIESENLPRIFEPFYTTKEPGKGTGLGLSIAYGIIRKHQGTIDVHSTPGKGTTFTITLPADTTVTER